MILCKLSFDLIISNVLDLLRNSYFLQVILFLLVIDVGIYLCEICTKSAFGDRKSKKFESSQKKEIKTKYCGIKMYNYAPKDDIMESPYFDNIDLALNDPKVCNLAILGNFSSGKSSVIQSYLNKNIRENNINEGEYITISLSEFEYDYKAKKMTKISLCDVEKEIVRQIFRSKLNKNVHNSVLSKEKIIKLTYYLCVFLFIFAQFEFNKKIKCYLSYLFSDILFDCYFCVLSFYFIYKFLSFIFENIRIEKATIKNFDIKIEKRNQCVIDAYTDQIIALFEKSICKYVILEDIERTNYLEVFTHLRNLNVILNGYLKSSNLPINKLRRVVFIYLINERVFSNPSGIVKFFDSSISINPISSYSNSSSLMLSLRGKLESFYEKKEKCGNSSGNKRAKCQNLYKKMFCKDNLTDDFLLKLSQYIIDTRVIYKLYNDYQTLINEFITLNSLEQHSENIFSIALIRTFYPNEYYALLSNKGELYNVLNRKNFEDLNSDFSEQFTKDNDYVCKYHFLKNKELLLYLLKEKKNTENYRIYTLNIARSNLSLDCVQFLISLYETKPHKDPLENHDSNLSIDNLNLFLSFMPPYLVQNNKILNYVFFISLLENSKITNDKYYLFIKKYFSAIVNNLYKRYGFDFLVNLPNIIFDKCKKIESMEDKKNNSTLIKLYFEILFSINTNRTKTELLKYILSEYKKYENDYDSYEKDLAANDFVLFLLEYYFIFLERDIELFFKNEDKNSENDEKNKFKSLIEEYLPSSYLSEKFKKYPCLKNPLLSQVCHSLEISLLDC